MKFVNKFEAIYVNDITNSDIIKRIKVKADNEMICKHIICNMSRMSFATKDFNVSNIYSLSKDYSVYITPEFYHELNNFINDKFLVTNFNNENIVCVICSNDFMQVSQNKYVYFSSFENCLIIERIKDNE